MDQSEPALPHSSGSLVTAPRGDASSVVSDDVAPARGWIRWLVPWVRAHRGAAALSVGAALLGTTATALIPVIERSVIDDVIGASDGSMRPYLLVLGALAVGRFAMTLIRRYAGGRLAYGVQNDLRDAVFDHLIDLDLAQHDLMPAGQLVSRANTDVNMVFQLLQMIAIVTGNFVMFVLAVGFMISFAPLLALIAVAVLALTFTIAWRMRDTVYVSTWDASQREAEMTAVAEEAISGVRVVKGFGQEDREVDRYVDALDRLFGGRVRMVRIRALFTSVLQIVPVLGQVVVLGVGGWLAVHGQVTVGTLVAFFSFLTQLAAPARMMAMFLAGAQQARSGAERLQELLGTRAAIADAPDALNYVPSGPAAVHFDDVTFGYDIDHPVLVGCTLEIAPGERVAVVGSSGSGKTTLAMLLARFVDPTDGAVRIDGHDLVSLSLSSLRSQVGLAFEEAFLFAGTIRDNIAYGRPDATDAEVTAAARLAQADRFIQGLPDGYDQHVGEAGVTLSGGQRQRIGLARVLLCDPAIVVLDDATSAVDAEVEHAIHDALATALAGRTTLLIAHRRSTLALADRIVVLDEGRIVAQGTQAELEKSSRRFRELLSGLEDADDATAGESHGILRTPRRAAADDTDHRVVPTTRLDANVRGGGHRGGGGMWIPGAGLIGPATPELLAAVDALPEIRDSSRVDADAHRPDRGSLAFVRFLATWKAELSLGAALVILDALATLAIPMLIRSGIDRGVTPGDLGVVAIVAGVAFAVGAFDAWVMWFENLVTGRAAERVLTALRIRLFAHLQRLGLDFYDRERSGRLLTRLTSDIDTLQQLLSNGLVNAAVAFVTFVGIGVALLALQVHLALAVFAVTLPLILATWIYQRLSRPAYDRQRDAISTVLSDLAENLAGVRVTQAFVRQDRNRDRFHAFDDEFEAAGMGALKVQIGYFAFVELLSTIGVIVVLGYGAVLHDRGALTVGALTAFLLYLTQFFSPIQQLSAVFDTAQQSAAGIRKLDSLLTERPSVVAPADPAPVPEGGRICLDHVSFTYHDQGVKAIAGIDLEIPAGQRVALVGETGSGKSTLVKLLARFYDPSSGTVSVHDVDLRSLDPGAYRRRLGYVPQEPYLFAGTIRDNLVYGDPDASDALVDEAIEAVGLGELVEGLEDGVDHWLVERGRSLSTGQRQLVCLARALVADPMLLLLDEATSNLDLASEARIERAIDVLSRGRTTVIIAHRLATAARADRILVMDAGRIVEDGTHDELLALQGRYSTLWQAYEGVAVTA